MSLIAAPAVLAAGLVLAATGGPLLVRSAAPMLMRVPRIAVLLLIGSLALWLLAVASLSLLLSWIVTGPQILPTAVGDVCQRCIAAASPFGRFGSIETAVPVMLLLLLPVLGVLVFAGLGIPRWLRRYRATLRICRDLTRTARRTQVAGYSVALIPDSRPVAFSLPRRSGGIVISDGLCAALRPDELAAVLAHERAHLRQRHHLILTLMSGLTGPLRWVPLAAVVAEAVPRYLEIAADNAARRRSGTSALAAALLKIAGPQAPVASSGEVAGSLLHAAGPDRIEYLVAPGRVRSALLPVSTLGFQLAVFVIVVSTVLGPYLYAAITGCQLPS